MRHRGLAFLALFLFALAACNGGPGGPAVIAVPGTPVPTAGTATVSFLVIVPPAGSSRARPHVVVPSNATSVKFTLDSVNGNTYSGTPTTETLTATTAGCQSVNNQLSCLFNLPAPVGTLIYTVTVYNGTTVIAEGNVSLTSTNGSTVSAPLTLTGTVSKIVLSVGAGVAGIKLGYAVTVQAEDANGYTILGNYASAITLTDTDPNTPVATSITTSGSDNPAAGELISSSDTATLNYSGGTMSSAATISAKASGVSASNITNATFKPVTTYLAQSGSVAFGVTIVTEGYAQNATPSPNPAPVATSTTLPPVTIATGQTFGSASNLVGVSGLSAQDAINLNGQLAQLVAIPSPSPPALSSTATTYYAWSSSAGTAVLGLAGYSDPSNEAYGNLTFLSPAGSLVQTCAPPYPQLLVVPFPTSWNVFSGAGTCTTVYTDTSGETDTYAYAANGSYTDAYNVPGGGWLYCTCVNGTSSLSVDAAGDISYTINGLYGEGTMSVPVPSPGASTVPVTFNLNNSAPFMPTASPAPSTAPNPWRAIGLANGTPPSPLLQDTMTTNTSSIASLPTACAVPAGLVPATSPPLTEVDETIVAADPMDDFLPLYTSEKIKHYYLNGVGEVCNENQMLIDVYDGVLSNGFFIGPTGGPPVWSFGPTDGGAIAWYANYDQNWDSFYTDTYTYITQTTLTAVQSRVRDFTKVVPAATDALTAATYAIAHSALSPQRLMQMRGGARTRSAWPRR